MWETVSLLARPGSKAGGIRLTLAFRSAAACDRRPNREILFQPRAKRAPLLPMPRIAISYRRDDSLDITGRVFEHLERHYGREVVFRDIDNILPGEDFRKHINTVL